MKFITPNWPAPKHIKAYTTLKTSWGKRSAFHAYKRNHPLADQNAYQKESESLINLLSLPSEPIWLTQNHSNIALEAVPQNKNKIADASFTKQLQTICIVVTADCLPILMTDRAGQVVAAAHAGWRGLAAGIIESTLNEIQVKPEEMLIWLGPAIGPSRFEVGVDVFDAFIQEDKASIKGFESSGPNKWFANLYTLATHRLERMGITHIYGGNFCTFSQTEFFYSYRRDGSHQGQMASLIWMNDKRSPAPPLKTCGIQVSLNEVD